MLPPRWQRVKAVFADAIEQPVDARRAFLARACAGDPDLLREVEALVAAHDTAGGFLEQPAQIDLADLEGLAPGTRVGAYRIVEEIGRGGMGIVYLAEDTRLGRRVAVKALSAAAGASPELRERLAREARAAATISHPGVASVFALEEAGGELFIVSEYVEGETLRGEIARGPVPVERARAIAIAIAEALAAAHAAGVVHRDLKPENVILTPAGGVKLVDFGIAWTDAMGTARLTRSGTLLGTPAYMAPEQLLGRTNIDGRADLYALGIILSEMLTGRHPLSPVPPGTADPPVPPRLAAVIARCLQPDPSDRYASTKELLAELAGTGAGAPAPSRARWWWEFHQGAVAAVYWITLIPAWQARALLSPPWPRAFFIALLAAVVVAANLRLHLWFTSRFYPDQLKWARRRARRWIHAADWTFAAVLLAGGLAAGGVASALPEILIGVGLGSAVAFLVIEPATTRAAFGKSDRI
ncbi:MAG TPA: serine/threonine-protein kinase [Vicinamibacterales bacterium]|nr:serine/threonine-protein kinase [Vicinamibacterales bacterium]